MMKIALACAVLFGSGNLSTQSYAADVSTVSQLLNSQYYTNGNNAISDFDGVGNTKVLTGLATGQSDWKTAASIINNSGSTYYPAACCCWRYHTLGTN